MKISTNILKRIAVFSVSLLLGLGFVSAQDAALTFSGSVDTYFRTNLNSTDDPDNGGVVAPGTSFANLPGFSLGMVNLVTAYEGEKVGFVGDLVFGPRGAEAVFGSPGVTSIVNQLYVYWSATDRLTFTLGNFNTFLGYEVISPTGNFNYSTSYMFSYGPFSHTGLKADLDLGSGFSLMGAVMNPTDATDFNPSGKYTGGAQLGYSNDAGGAWLNALFNDDYFQIDLTTGWNVSESVYVGLNATSATDNFYGVAGYFQVATTESLALGLRGEYFVDKGVGVLSEDESVFDLTVSANYSVGNLTFIPEVRVDAFSEEDYVVTDAVTASPEFANSLSSFVLAAVYAF